MLNINQTKKISGELKSDVFFCEQIDGPIPMRVISGLGGGGVGALIRSCLRYFAGLPLA